MKLVIAEDGKGFKISIEDINDEAELNVAKKQRENILKILYASDERGKRSEIVNMGQEPNIGSRVEIKFIAPVKEPAFTLKQIEELFVDVRSAVEPKESKPEAIIVEPTARRSETSKDENERWFAVRVPGAVSLANRAAVKDLRTKLLKKLRDNQSTIYGTSAHYQELVMGEPLVIEFKLSSTNAELTLDTIKDWFTDLGIPVNKAKPLSPKREATSSSASNEESDVDEDPEELVVPADSFLARVAKTAASNKDAVQVYMQGLLGSIKETGPTLQDAIPALMRIKVSLSDSASLESAKSVLTKPKDAFLTGASVVNKRIQAKQVSMLMGVIAYAMAWLEQRDALVKDGKAEPLNIAGQPFTAKDLKETLILFSKFKMEKSLTMKAKYANEQGMLKSYIKRSKSMSENSTFIAAVIVFSAICSLMYVDNKAMAGLFFLAIAALINTNTNLYNAGTDIFRNIVTNYEEDDRGYESNLVTKPIRLEKNVNWIMNKLLGFMGKETEDSSLYRHWYKEYRADGPVRRSTSSSSEETQSETSDAQVLKTSMPKLMKAAGNVSTLLKSTLSFSGRRKSSASQKAGSVSEEETTSRKKSLKD